MSALQRPSANGWRTFLVTWVTQSLSVFGSGLTYFSLSIWLTQTLYPQPEQQGQLAFALAAITLAHTLPMVISMPFAGAWADRHDRRKTMLAADLTNGAMSVVLMVLMATGGPRLWNLVLILAVMSVVGTFHNSAFDASYAMLVPEKLLPRANGMMLTMWSLAGIFSPALAALIISMPALARQGHLPAFLGSLHDGVPLVVALDALSFFVAGVTMLFVHIPSPRCREAVGQPQRRSLWADMREGALFIWDRRPMLWLISTFTVVNFLTVPVIMLEPLLVKYNLRSGVSFEAALATVSSMSGVGGVIGGVLISAWGGLKRRRVYGVVIPAVIAALANAALGLSSALVWMAVAALIGRMAFPIMDAHNQAIWQAQTPVELQGRVFAVRRTIAQVSGPVGSAVAGAIGGLFGPPAIVVAMSLILAVFCMVQLFNPYLKPVDDKAWLDQLAAEAQDRRLQA